MLHRVLQPLLPVDRFKTADRRVTLTIWIAGVVQGFSQAQLSTTLPYTRTGLGMTESEASLLLGLARLAAFAAFPIGWLADRRGRRRPFIAAVGLILVGGVVTGVVVESWQVGLTHGVLRTGVAAASGLAVVILAESVGPAVRSYAIAFYGAAVAFGSGLAVFTLPLADDGPEAWRIPHLITGAGILLVPVLARRLPETPINLAAGVQHHWTQLARGPWASRFWRVAIIGFVASAYGTFVTAFTTERLISELSMPTGTTVGVVLTGGTIGGLGFFVGGHLADRWGRRPTSVMALCLGLVGGVALFTAESVEALIPAIIVSTFGGFALVPAGGAHRAELFPSGLRSSAGTAAANFSLAGSAAGLVAGAAVIAEIGLSGAVYVLAAGMAVAALVTATLPETRGQDLTAVFTAPR